MPTYRSQNGFTAAKTPSGIPSGVKSVKVAGTTSSFRVRADCADIFQYLIDQLHERVEPVNIDKTLDDWSYVFRMVRGSTNNLSNHSSATAIDYNAVRHPLGVRWDRNFTEEDRRQINLICDVELEGVIDWGGKWRRPDAMHFEIAPGTSLADIERVTKKIKGRRPPAKPKPPTPIGRVSLVAVQQAFRDGSVPTDRGAGDNDGVQVQRALNKAMGTDLVEDGELGRNTRAVAAAFQAKTFGGKPWTPTALTWDADANGILGQESLQKLGFEVLA